MNLGFSRRNVVRHVSAKSRPSIKRRRLRFDCLEDRRLLSGGSLSTPGTAITVDSSGSLQNDSPRAVAMDSAGDAVVSWAEQNSATGTWNLMFQQYTNNSGTPTPVTPSPITVASNVTAGDWEFNVGSIMVARAPTTGDFVVVWETGTNVSSTNTSGTYSTHAQLYSSAGVPIGSALLLKGSDMPESVAMNDTGFDVLYAALPKRGSAYTLEVQRYSYTASSDAAAGSAISVVTPGYDQGGNQSGSMAMDANGNFVVGWRDWINNNTSNTPVIDAELFTSAGKGQGVIQVASANGNLNQTVVYGDVAMDTAGNFVLDWTLHTGGGAAPYDVQARQFTTGGVAVQAETTPIIVATESYNPGAGGLAELPDGNTNGNGAFDITWINQSPAGIYAATYNASGTQTQSLAVSTAGTESSAAVDGNSDLFVVYNASGVYGQFYLDPPAPAPSATSLAASSSSATAPPGGSATAATDAVFAAYAYPGDDEMLG